MHTHGRHTTREYLGCYDTYIGSTADVGIWGCWLIQLFENVTTYFQKAFVFSSCLGVFTIITIYMKN